MYFRVNLKMKKPKWMVRNMKKNDSEELYTYLQA